MTRLPKRAHWLLTLWAYVEVAQREGYNRTTAYGAYRKAGGTVSANRFRTLWQLALRNPFRWNRAT